jgi:hypothetical protein
VNDDSRAELGLPDDESLRTALAQNVAVQIVGLGRLAGLDDQRLPGVERRLIESASLSIGRRLNRYWSEGSPEGLSATDFTERVTVLPVMELLGLAEATAALWDALTRTRPASTGDP